MKLSVIVIAESQSAVSPVDGDIEYIGARYWGDGVQQARGERVAVLNDRYQPHSGWIDAAKNTVCEMSWGTVEPGDAGWPYYLLEYAHLLGNQDPRRAPAGNVVYHRSVLDRYPLAGFAREVDYHAHLVSQGVSTAFTQALSVTLVHPPEWAVYRKQRFEDSKKWARTHHPGLLALPLRLALPPLILYRVARAVFSDGRYVNQFFKWLPRLIESSFIQMLGEMSGILAGDSNDRVSPR